MFVGWHVWIFLFVCLVDAILKRGKAELYSKIFLYPAMVMLLIYVWIIVAIGRLGEIRWWPSRDRLSRLVPPSIKNATMTKCRWTLLFLSILSALTSDPLVIHRQVKALRCLGLSGPSDTYAKSKFEDLAPFFFVYFLCLCMVGGFIRHGILNLPMRVKLVDIVILDLVILFYLVPVFHLVELCTRLLHYFRYFASLWFSGLYRELP